MPITQSAKKALRQSVRRHTQNLARSETYKNTLKETRALVSTGKIEEAKKLLPALQRALDKAVKTGVIKKNKASRLKSRVAASFATKK